ncbi:MAG: hypothetical protein C0597_06280 [Marinilabiliales bacterium]|nr:MAG: hypothetical protein C0597_06280 [Marinilabiliales bacterium]
MKRIYIISLIIVSLISSCKDNKMEQENDAIYKSIKKIYTLNADGSIIYQYQHRLKYITHLSFNRLYGESFIVYNSEQQELKINKAETKMVDGKIVPSPENAFNEILPHLASGVPAYNHLREMVVTHTALEPGCIVDFDYELKSNPDYLPFLSENLVLNERVPIENLEIIVNIPENIELNYKLINAEGEPIVSHNEGLIQYKWTFKNSGINIREPNQSHDQSFLPRLILSTANVENAFSNICSQDDLKLTSDIEFILRNRIFGIKNSVKMIQEFKKIVVNELKDFNIPMEYSGYKIRPLIEVWNSGGGTQIEKTFLLNEFIKYIGFESEIVIAIPPSFYDKNVGCIKDFGNFYVLAHIDGEDILLATNPDQPNNLLFELKDYGFLNLEGSSINLPDFIDNTESIVSVNGSLKLNKSGDLTGDAIIKVQGIKNPYLNYLANVKSAKEVAASVFSSNSIIDFNVVDFDQNKSEVETKIEEKEIWKNQGDYYFFELPASMYGLKGEHLPALLNERQTPLKLSYPVNESYDFSIAIPEGYNFISPSVNKELRNEIGSVKIEISSNENLIHAVKSLKINTDEISPAEYANLKSILDIWNKKNYNEIILKLQE